MRDTIGGKQPIEPVQTRTPWSSSPLVSRAAQFMQTPWKQSSVRKAGERGERDHTAVESGSAYQLAVVRQVFNATFQSHLEDILILADLSVSTEQASQGEFATTETAGINTHLERRDLPVDILKVDLVCPCHDRRARRRGRAPHVAASNAAVGVWECGSEGVSSSREWPSFPSFAPHWTSVEDFRLTLTPWDRRYGDRRKRRP